MELNSSYASTIERLETEVARLQPFETQQKMFYEQRKQFYEEMVNGENALHLKLMQSGMRLLIPTMLSAFTKRSNRVTSTRLPLRLLLRHIPE